MRDDYNIARGNRTARAVATLTTVLNITVALIVTFEAVVRLCTFLKEWRPTTKRRMGFGKDDRRSKP